MTTLGQGELLVDNGRPFYGAGALSVKTCGFCRVSFTVPTPPNHVHNVRLEIEGQGTLTPHAVWCKVR